MICIVTAQELRLHLGDVTVRGKTCTEWIDGSLTDIARDFLNAEHKAILECVAPDGSVLDTHDGR